MEGNIYIGRLDEAIGFKARGEPSPVVPVFFLPNFFWGAGFPFQVKGCRFCFPHGNPLGIRGSVGFPSELSPVGGNRRAEHFQLQTRRSLHAAAAPPASLASTNSIGPDADPAGGVVPDVCAGSVRGLGSAPSASPALEPSAATRGTPRNSLHSRHRHQHHPPDRRQQCNSWSLLM